MLFNFILLHTFPTKIIFLISTHLITFIDCTRASYMTSTCTIHNTIVWCHDYLLIFIAYYATLRHFCLCRMPSMKHARFRFANWQLVRACIWLRDCVQECITAALQLRTLCVLPFFWRRAWLMFSSHRRIDYFWWALQRLKDKPLKPTYLKT